MKKIVFMHLDNVVINVFVSNVIKIKVILIKQYVLFVEHNISIENQGIDDYGNDFENCKIISDKGSI